MPRCVVLAALATAAALSAETPIIPVKDLKPGMRGSGKTVFSGNRIENFDVEILGVLENIGPKQNLILGRLSGGPLEKTGVMQGMSGSPVYIDGKLAGAVAMAFPFAKEPIAGIRPIEEMLPVASAPPDAKPVRTASLLERDLIATLPKRGELFAGSNKMIDIATPLSFGGFTAATIERFAPQLRALGLEPQQGVSSGGRMNPRMGDPAMLQPGSMISVELMSGDLSIGADGTVTHIDGDRVYAFGHRFLSVGSTALPFARAEVLTLLPVLSSSFKISTPRELMGTISQDRSTAIAGRLGQRAAMVPVSIAVQRGGKPLDTYRMDMVDDRYLSPVLLQMATFSAIDATERLAGASSLLIKGQINFRNGTAPLAIRNMYTADSNSALPASLSAAIPLVYVMQSGFAELAIRDVALTIESSDEKKLLQIDGVTLNRREVRPGETVELTAYLSGENGVEVTRKASYRVPVGAPQGTLYFTVADSNVTNITEFRQILNMAPRSAAQVVSIVSKLKDNTKAYVRVWRNEPAFQLEGEDLPDPPASVSMILSSVLATQGGITQTRNSKVAEMEINAGEVAIAGSKTVQVEVKP